MKAYLIRRLLFVPVALLGISLLTFFVLQLMPGNPVNLRLMKLQGAMASDSVPQDIIEKTKAMYGLDKPLGEQYVAWVGRLVRLDFGKSFNDRQPVRKKILEAAPITLMFNLIAFFLIYTIAIPLGIFSATKNGTLIDRGATVGLFLLYSLPNFWVAMLLIYFLASGHPFEWFPIYGLNEMGASQWSFQRWFADRLWHMILPLFCLVYVDWAYISRYMRSDMLETIRQDYIRTANAFGFSSRVVAYKYAFRNSLISLITLIATLLPALLGGSIIIEQIFSIPGMGRLFFDAIAGRDYPVVMGIVTISAVLTLFGLILQDILYAVVDPRIRFDRTSQ